MPFMSAPPVAVPRNVPRNPAPAPRPESPRPPVVRLQAPDEPPPPPPPAPAPLVVPAPEQLGIAAATAAAPMVRPDWARAHDRLDRLGATGFHLEKLADGACRCICLLPGGQPGVNQRIEARGKTADEAVRLVLDEAERWAAAAQR